MAPKGLLFCFIISAHSLYSDAFQSDQSCPPNQVYLECGRACEGTCTSPTVGICPPLCFPPGCYCALGAVRNEDGDCVMFEDCPGETCALNEAFFECGPHPMCEATCTSSDTMICPPTCYPPGCYCAPGAVRDEQFNCIRREQCPSRDCPPNQVYLDCGPSCEDTCESPVDGPCRDICYPAGCYCAPGTRRNDQGDCVTPDNCPGHGCPPNQVYTECGPPCNISCACPDVGPCPDICSLPGCHCAPGLIKNDQGDCVKQEHCPAPLCPPSEISSECGVTCEVRCGDSTIGFCPDEVYPPRCFCTPGRVRNEQGACVRLEDCP